MSVLVMIYGQSGTGKSTSLRNFSRDDVAIVNVSGKPLPFRNNLKTYKSDNYQAIMKAIQAAPQKSIVIDDATYLMVNEFMRTAKQTGYQKYTDMACSFNNLIEFAAEALTGIPSIIFGLAGMVLFSEMFGLKQGILAGGLTLVMMILPVIVRTTQESLKTVPNAYREGALAMGASKWHMVRTVVLPNAIDGIVTGCILSVGRIVGESAALLFTAGFGLVLNDFITALESSSATLTVALYVYASERGETSVAFAIAVILMTLTLLLNFSANMAAKKLKNV